MSDELLRIRDLRVAFPSADAENEVLHGVSLEVIPQEIVALVGESGSGKSMTCRSVIRLLPEGGTITSGTITFEGTDLLQVSEKELYRTYRRRIAYVFQDPSTYLNPVLTIEEQLEESAPGRRRDARRACIDALELAELPDPDEILDRYPHELSGGMKQRAMIAMALIRDPDLLLADEITTALDVTTQARLLRTILRLRDGLRLTVLFVTHDLGVAGAIADRVAVMRDGNVVEVGPTRRVMHEPEHPYTTQLLDDYPRSQLTAHLEAKAVLTEHSPEEEPV